MLPRVLVPKLLLGTIFVKNGSDSSLVPLTPSELELIETHLGRLGRSRVGSQTHLGFRGQTLLIIQPCPLRAIWADEEKVPPVALFHPQIGTIGCFLDGPLLPSSIPYIVNELLLRSTVPCRVGLSVFTDPGFHNSVTICSNTLWDCLF